jgi:hypothetical protein
MITLQDLSLAYRKAKVDLYYSSHASLDAIASYEENLHSNLFALLQKINDENEDWVKEPEFIGTWMLVTKTINMDCWTNYKKKNGGSPIFSSPAEEWKYALKILAKEEPPSKPEAQFRVMARCSLDFHVLSSLWIMEVGRLFDAKLSDSAYGNRLRRTQDGKDINKLSLGSFQPYLKPFRDWRDNGIAAMRTALNSDKKIVALTADVSSFYHELNSGFMLNPAFIIDILKLDLTEFQCKLHRLFITALQAWAAATPLQKGLPVGLPASAIVANMALIELDNCIEQQAAPIYYGRYVDDILLVMENCSDFGSTVEVWEWLFDRSSGRLNWVDKAGKHIIYNTAYLSEGPGKSRVHFDNDKNKVFLLAGETGKTMVDAIAHQIHSRASEWRAMPRLPRSATHVSTDLLAATQSDGEAADSLRKADVLTMRRASFAIKLRDFEAYERDLPPEAWAEHRRAFFRAAIQHVLVLPQFFDLAVYLPRIVRLATACEDFAELRRIIEVVIGLTDETQDRCCIKIKASPDINAKPETEKIMLSQWKLQLFTSIRESIAAAFPPHLSKAGKQAWHNYMTNYHSVIEAKVLLSWPSSAKLFQAQQARLFSFDLAHMPFRFIGLPKEMVAQRGIPAKKGVTEGGALIDLLPHSILKGAQILAQWIGFKTIPQGLPFATRPFNLPELFILNRHAYLEVGREDMQAVVLSVRGFKLGEKAPHFDKNNVLQIPDGVAPRKYGIAVSSLQTSLESWTACVMRMPDPDVQRYFRLCHLLDGVIAQPRESRYLILPELALPAHWFMRIARKLQGRGISLITGIEYLHATKSRVRNQVWAALSHDGLGFPSLMVYCQDKQLPALHEEQELQRLAGLEMKPDKVWKKPPIIQHGDFRFALLICSELTNIQYRADLRGKVDALFVPEWNPDTETFNALVESSALDIHAYIIQCNDRQYGDSRIRAPYKESWKRDLLRVKGGVTDYCVIGEIDVQSLRQFQSSHRSPAKPFKPVPDGFKEAMDYQRKVLPKSDDK